jgi:hypothetical protein
MSFVEPEGSLQFSQQHTTSPCPEPYESSQQPISLEAATYYDKPVNRPAISVP